MSTQPMTGHALIALVESHLSGMSESEQDTFWMLATGHDDNAFFKTVVTVIIEHGSTREKVLTRRAMDNAHLVKVFASQLMKHRKPAKNAERDAEIMRLKGEL